MENILSDMRNQINNKLHKGYLDGKFIVSANPNTLLELVKGLKETYGEFLDIEKSISRNEFIFKVDNIVLSLHHNHFLADRVIKLIPKSHYEIRDRINICKFTRISDLPNYNIFQEIIDFCISKNIKINLVKVREENDSLHIFTDEPYKYIFLKYGVNNDSVEIASKKALELLEVKIERSIQSNLTIIQWRENNSQNRN